MLPSRSGIATKLQKEPSLTTRRCILRNSGGGGNEITPWNNMEVQFSEFPLKKGVNLMNLEVVAVRLTAQSISHYISLARCIRNSTVVICYALHPSLLMEV